jgi:hypothetical protein
MLSAIEAVAFQTKNLNQLLLSMTLKSQDLVKHLNEANSQQLIANS